MGPQSETEGAEAPPQAMSHTLTHTNTMMSHVYYIQLRFYSGGFVR